MTTLPTDIETPPDDIELEIDPDEPLIAKPSLRRSRERDARYHRSSLTVTTLDPIPPIIKSANGNIFWADEQCVRRTGLTSTEARLFLRLLQTDGPENYNYADYKAMFDDFGREQSYLEELVRNLPWWKIETYHQRPIWQARIKWLRRMGEPRLWLLYLMARRRRILGKAAGRVLLRFREIGEMKKIERKMGGKYQGKDEKDEDGNLRDKTNEFGRRPGMVSDAAQTSEQLLTTPPIKAPSQQRPTMINDASQTSEQLLNLPVHRAKSPPSSPSPSPAKPRRPSPVSKLRSSISSHIHRLSHESHSRSSAHDTNAAHCPVFDRPFEATRSDIKKIVELLMPQPKPYIVIGWFLRSASDPKERILEFGEPSELFHVLRKGEADVRGWRRFVSLKSLRGFGLYKCDITHGAHLPLLLTASQKAIMSQFFLAYKASYRHSDDTVAAAWQGWVAKNLNDGKENPLEGRYSLQLLYDWSSFRLSCVVMVPLLLSFVIGLWYMIAKGDIITAWTIALYIVTAAAAFIALLAIIGSLKDI